MDIAHLLFGFTGRIRRRDFWITFIILSLITSVSLGSFIGGFGLHHDMDGSGLLGLVVAVVVAWMQIAILIKRWHDRDKSGWWVLITLVPVIGWAWQVIECGLLDGTKGTNRYGLSPKGIMHETF